VPEPPIVGETAFVVLVPEAEALVQETRAQAVASIERWFEENADEPIGNVQAAALLNFFVAEIGPSIYNRAIADAQARLLVRVGELDIECHEDEFRDWHDAARKGRR
jgi:uncharacterized protein (DUF2164 family)